LATSVFSATAGTGLNFYFDYVTSDGAGFSDYAWAALFTSTGTLSELLFTARTEPSGTIVPGSGMPAIGAGVTLTPSSVPIIAGGPAWSPLGGSSGACYDVGCGYTGWVSAAYTIPTAGNYYLEIGTVNWLDTLYDTGLAMDGVTVGGVSILGAPEPSSFLLLGSGLAGLAYFAKRKRGAGRQSGIELHSPDCTAGRRPPLVCGRGERQGIHCVAIALPSLDSSRT